jgi:mono/diheme cytochrome c family protein
MVANSSTRRRARLLRVSAGIALAWTLGLGLNGPGMAADPPDPKKLNPYTGKAEAIKEGRALYLKYGCSGCHGVGGGGGMGPSLIKDTAPSWKFGSSDENMYKLIKGQMPGATMPPVFGQAMKDDEIWKVLAFVRSIYGGDPSRINW